MPRARAISQALAALCGLALAGCETAFNEAGFDIGPATAAAADAPMQPQQYAQAEPAAAQPQPMGGVEPAAAQPVLRTPMSPPPSAQQIAVSPTARPPSEIRSGFAEMVIQRVEREVSRAEVEATVQAMIYYEPICTPFPPVWMEDVTRNTFVVRYGLMARDWGQEAAEAARSRMDEFVTSGSLNQRERPEMSDEAVEYTITPSGRARMRGTIETGQRPAFCGPAERRLVEITSMEWGQFPCGSLRVRFTHVGDDWPSWARSEATRDRLAASWPPVGETAFGSVSFSRQWYRGRDLPSGSVNGALRSVCYDTGRERVIGNDLDLAAPAE